MTNAGTRSGSTAGALAGVEALDPSRGAVSLSEFADEYRKPLVDERLVVTGARFRLRRGAVEDIEREMEEARRRRRETQPRQRRSAGSVFKNPEGDSAGRLIEECGLKAMSVGGAHVSDVHANFIISEPGARARDIRTLMERVADAVEKAHGIRLEPEVRLVGFKEEGA
jgi:UDP-N-acetylmuramate dehydrogenase